MNQCYQSGDFHKYFTENMNALGLKVPSGLFETSEKAIGTAALILGALQKLGEGATMAEIAGATVALEKLMVLGAMSASGYVGAVIGSIAVATGRSLSCGSQIVDLFVFTRRHDLQFNNMQIFYNRHPEIFATDHINRKAFAAKCRIMHSSLRHS